MTGGELTGEVARWCCTMHPWRGSPFHMMRCYRHQMLAPRRDQGSPAKRGIKTRGALLVAAFFAGVSPPAPRALSSVFFVGYANEKIGGCRCAPLFRRPLLGARKGLRPSAYGLTPDKARPSASPRTRLGLRPYPGQGSAFGLTTHKARPSALPRTRLGLRPYH